MGKFNKPAVRADTGAGVIKTAIIPSGLTFEAAPGFARDQKSELFLLAVANFVGEATFYEKAGDRDSRYVQLIREVAVGDPSWTMNFLGWLRTDGNMRSASIVGAVEAARAFLPAGIKGGRQLVRSVLQRADEPGEAAAYWRATYPDKLMPISIKRAIGDGARKLYTEFSLLKYDTDSKGFRFGDVIEMTHPSPRTPEQNDLFRWAIERRHGRDTEIPASLPMLANNAELRRVVNGGGFTALTQTDFLRAAGMTWEDVLSLAGNKVPKRQLWEALIPTMAYMALLRNLRNFDEAKVSDEVAEAVAARLADPGEVAKSRQLPMRFLSAYRAAPSLRWGHALDKALTASMSNIPQLDGRTLILVDTSGSMNASFSKDGTLMRWDAAALFGIALGQRCESADVVSFSGSGWGGASGTKVFPAVPGESLLRAVERWKSGGYFIGNGTDTEKAVRGHYRAHDRVVILTDEQAAYHGYGDVAAAVPQNRPVYTWNLAGYRLGHTAGTSTRHTFGGLTDQGFKMIPLLEGSRSGTWPWMA